MTVKQLIRYLVCSLFAFTANTNASTQLSIVAAPDVINDYHAFIANRTPQDIKSFGGEFSRLDVIEILLIQQALLSSGKPYQFTLIPEESYTRILQKVASGTHPLAGISYSTIMLGDYRHSLLVSEAVIPEGSLDIGFYTSLLNTKTKNITGLADLKTLKVVSNRNWVESWAWLSGIELGHLYNTSHWHSMVKMVSSGRADLLLSPFPSSADRIIRLDDLQIQPVKGIKAVNLHSRHFVVSKTFPNSKTIFNDLSHGLKALNQAGMVRKALIESGAINEEAKDWVILGRQ